ncbi:MAG: bifunctional (p)ppGpp synthetase/guanosine-3',5'-bis(diphosphate) 3'-pyrophosphohydrolase, partial [Bacteroidales bacterium]|nr:bifunctional (p)ppGpp synthetase/guanosine-3',5'-bis(diphosphate) 3'-pyrophosphohydrolase [Bacteroidales bacterium]
LDFAFDIHSGLGVKCSGGRINGKAVPIREQVKTGDVIEIISGKNQKPSSDWLNFVVTSKARTKIKQKLSEFEFQKAADGKELLGRRLKNWKIELTDDILYSYLKKAGLKTANAFYAAIGEGQIDVNEVKDFILSYDAPVQPAASPAAPEASDSTARLKPSSKSGDDILVIDAKNVRGIEYKMSRCCNPVFGDDVFGFVTRMEGIKIHRISCPNASRLIEMYPYRIQKVRWASTPTTSSFQASLRISADLDPHVLNEIMDVVNAFKASIRAFNVSENSRTGTYDISMKVAVPSNLELDKVLSQLRNLKSVYKVSRA